MNTLMCFVFSVVKASYRSFKIKQGRVTEIIKRFAWMLCCLHQAQPPSATWKPSGWTQDIFSFLRVATVNAVNNQWAPECRHFTLGLLECKYLQTAHVILYSAILKLDFLLRTILRVIVVCSCYWLSKQLNRHTNSAPVQSLHPVGAEKRF